MPDSVLIPIPVSMTTFSDRTTNSANSVNFIHSRTKRHQGFEQRVYAIRVTALASSQEYS